MRRALFTLLLLTACGGVDADGDGFAASVDCDDADDAVFPDADEICDGIDNDCDGAIDDEDDDAVGPTWYRDADGDGFGGDSLGAICAPPPGNVVREGGDCDDDVVAVNPDATEVCNGYDDDCDGRVDDADPSVDPSTYTTFYQDNDGDGYGTALFSERACAAPDGMVADGTDCDDGPDGANRSPGATEVCDGIDNDCDIADGLLIDDDDPDVDYTGEPIYYLDRDGDGFGDADTEFQACDPPFNAVQVAGDCDDGRRIRFPGNPEVCDGFDNDCDGYADDLDWWDDAWPYRVTVSVQTPPWLSSPPVAADVDFAAALAQLGDTTGLAPDSVRVVLQRCAAGWPTMGAEFVDGLQGVFDAAPSAAPLGDEAGSVVFLYDTDGDYSTREEATPTTALTFGVYFGSQGTSAGVAPAVPITPLSLMVTGATATLRSGASTATFDAAQGGLSTSMGVPGGTPTIGAQASTLLGNGMFLAPAVGGDGSNWVPASDDALASLTTVHQGSMLAVLRAEGNVGNAEGAFDFTYDYFMFAHRPELYAKVRFTTSEASGIGPQGTQWGAAVRPLQVDNVALAAGTGVAVAEDPGFNWVYATYGGDAEGVYLAYRTSVLQRNNPVSTDDGRHIGLAGQDLAINPPDARVVLPAGADVVDHAVIMVYPYVGPRVANEDRILGAIRGVDGVVGAAQAR